MERYIALIQAAKIIASARFQVSRDDGLITSPAWSMLNHAENRLIDQAAKELRADISQEILAEAK